ncbi:BrnA antitoxin family protein [Methylovulum psychrotolerans]|uniref:BrnA antitoxin family protein n=1 Tax=Methylovulum psychrotolerans TaxID=1704499 RepID=UPI001BFF360D|nr:BrnA antitoxin family protein [Methylovulum psychrotolerans]MBT9097244.1 BrnA antitoxin family protein [Methylovulum psychrotolerans]
MSAKITTDTQTDWARLARRDDSEIDYSDAPPMPLDLPSLRVRQPIKQEISGNGTAIIVDADIVTWFKTHNANYQDSINQLLREYMQHELAR